MPKKNQNADALGMSFQGMHNRRRRGAVVKPKNLKGSLRRLLRYFIIEKKLLIFILTFILIDCFIVLVIPYLIGKCIDAVSYKNTVNFNLLLILTIVLGAAYFGDNIISLAEGWLMAGISQKIVKIMRSDLFSKLQKLPVSFFDTHSSGDTMSRFSNDIDNVSSVIAQSTVQLASGIIAIAGTVILMLFMNLILTAASMITVPLFFILTRTIAKKTNVLFKKQQAKLGMINSQIEESISGIQVVKAFNHEEKLIDEFEKTNSELCDVGLKAQIWSGFMMPLMNVINNLGFVTIAWIGAVLNIKGIVSVGVIASFINYLKQFTRPLNAIGSIFNNLQSGVAGAERVFDILDEKEEAEDLKDAIIMKDVKGNVTFKNVTFGYTPDKTVLKNISFEVPYGSSVALVGPTGAGKTTIANLITRFYDINSGEILIDGIDVKKYTRDSLRKCFGIVLQDTYLFSGTVKENIKYGRLDASDEEIVRAARFVNADNFITRLPKGYDTIIEESGGSLSQGQKQLLTIARAILAKPSILILDEATSSVDTRTELKIQEAMLKIMNGRTSFVIAHRLSTIINCDMIMVIDDGRIVEKGNHEELLNLKGRYYDMYCSQVKTNI